MRYALLLVFLTGCATVPPAQEFGPTHQAKTSSGYTLSNRKLIATIDEHTGAVELHGLTGQADKKIVPTFSPLADSQPTNGYVEARDEQTWQFYGPDKTDQLQWRIVYSLDVQGLSVSYIVQNKSNLPLTGWVSLPGCSAHIEPFNENDALNHPQADGSIRSDEHTLKPGERVSFTTRWTLQ